MHDFHPLYYVWEHRLPIFAALAALVTAAAKTAPVPKPEQVWRCWAYDFSHQVFNITNVRLTATPIITPPESAPKP